MNRKHRKTSNAALLCAMLTSIATLSGAYYMSNNRVYSMDSKDEAEPPLVAAVNVDTECAVDFNAEDVANSLHAASEYTTAAQYAYRKGIEDAKRDHALRATIVVLNDTADQLKKYSDDQKRVINKSPNDITCVSGLSAAQFDKLIDKIIDHRGLSSSNKLHGTGASFEYIEKEYSINGIYVLAIFTQESGFATRCANTNNFAGVKASRGYKYFETPSDCISYEGRLLRTKYVDMGLVSLEAIGRKYCETGSWATNVGDIVDTYLGMLDSIV